MFGYKSFRDNQYIAINWLRVRNSLHSVEKVEERFSPSRIRQIKKGLKNGAQVREARTKEEILCFAPRIFFQDTAPLPQHQVLSASRKPVDKRAAKQNLHRHL
jgi:hypothetical protein